MTDPRGRPRDSRRLPRRSDHEHRLFDDFWDENDRAALRELWESAESDIRALFVEHAHLTAPKVPSLLVQETLKEIVYFREKRRHRLAAKRAFLDWALERAWEVLSRELMRALYNGKKDAYTVVDSHWRPIVARRIVKWLKIPPEEAVADAGSVLINVLATVEKKGSRYKQAQGPFGAWLMQVTDNWVVKYARNLNRFEFTEVTDEALGAVGSSVYSSSFWREKVRHARDVLERHPRYYARLTGVPTDEIMRRYGMTEGATNTAISREKKCALEELDGLEDGEN